MRQQRLFSRREMLFFTGAGLFLRYRNAMSGELQTAVEAVDHLLLGVSDLDYGIQWMQERSGVKAVIGGVHPGRGTRNALLSLGGKRYLEIIAPDPAQTEFKLEIDIRKMDEPRLILWAASAKMLNLSKTAPTLGFPVFGPQDGSRKKPDGSTLSWKSLMIQTPFAESSVNPFPFFIEWSVDSIHPSQDAPAGCQLTTFILGHPRSEELRSALKTLGIDATVRQSDSPRLFATLSTPKGKLILA